MASSVLLHLLLTAVLFRVTSAGDCSGYMTRSGFYKEPETCSYLAFCCGTCENRYCCWDEYNRLSNSAQITCNVKTLPLSNTAIGLTIAGIVIVFISIITCCCCCCSCCKKPRPAIETTTTVQCTMHSPPMQGGQYPAYQPVPTLQAYGGQAMPAGPYQTQPYAPGPPPPYQTVVGPGQSGYLFHAPAQAGFAYPPPTDTMNQPAYNPAYMQSPDSGY